MDATPHFRFSGTEAGEATVTIRQRSLTVEDGPVGWADVVVRRDGRIWLQFVRKERGLLGLLLSRKLRRKALAEALGVGKCFP